MSAREVVGLDARADLRAAHASCEIAREALDAARAATSRAGNIQTRAEMHLV